MGGGVGDIVLRTISKLTTASSFSARADSYKTECREALSSDVRTACAL